MQEWQIFTSVVITTYKLGALNSGTKSDTKNDKCSRHGERITRSEEAIKTLKYESGELKGCIQRITDDISEMNRTMGRMLGILSERETER